MCEGEDITRRGFGDGNNVHAHTEGGREIDCKAVSAWGIVTSTMILHSATIPIILLVTRLNLTQLKLNSFS